MMVEFSDQKLVTKNYLIDDGMKLKKKNTQISVL